MKKIFLLLACLFLFALLWTISPGRTLVLAADMKTDTGMTVKDEKMMEKGDMEKKSEMMKEEEPMKKETGMMNEGESMKKETGMMKQEGSMNQEKEMMK